MNAIVSVVEPLGVVTTIVCALVPAGVMAVIVVAETTVKLVTAKPPIVTAEAPVKLVPVMVIAVPPEVDPLSGTTEMIVGVVSGTVDDANVQAACSALTPSKPGSNVHTLPLAVYLVCASLFKLALARVYMVVPPV